MPPRAITQVCPQCQMPLVLPASFAGKIVPCSRRGHAVQVGGAASPPTGPTVGAPAAGLLPPHLASKLATPVDPVAPPAPQPSGPKPPHLLKAEAANPQAAMGESSVAPDELAEQEQPEPSSCLARGCLMMGVASFVLAGILGAAILVVQGIRWWQEHHVAKNVEEQPGKINKKDYTDASHTRIKYAGIAVRIDKVQVGKVDFRSKGEILQTATTHYLIINVNVMNTSRSEPVEYHSWYDSVFEDEAGNRQDVVLRDDNGREWKLFRVPEAENVERHVKSEATLPMADDITDSLVFKLPEQYIDEPIPALYLDLPGVAVGETTYFRFQIPLIMIDRREK